MTYRDVRFLVDDLNLALKDPAPKVDTSDVSKNASAAKAAPTHPETPEKKGLLDKAKEKLGLGKSASGPDEGEPSLEDEIGDADAELDELPGGAGNVTVAVDKVTLTPGAVASGSVTFSDGVSGKWIIDQYGRPGFTEVSQPGYRPKPEDAQAFMQELTRTLQQRGY